MKNKSSLQLLQESVQRAADNRDKLYNGRALNPRYDGIALSLSTETKIRIAKIDEYIKEVKLRIAELRAK